MSCCPDVLYYGNPAHTRNPELREGPQTLKSSIISCFAFPGAHYKITTWSWAHEKPVLSVLTTLKVTGPATLLSVSCSLLVWGGGLPFPGSWGASPLDLYAINSVTLLPLCGCIETVPSIKTTRGVSCPQSGNLAVERARCRPMWVACASSFSGWWWAYS